MVVRVAARSEFNITAIWDVIGSFPVGTGGNSGVPAHDC